MVHRAGHSEMPVFAEASDELFGSGVNGLKIGLR
jgi:hypothetical protein